MGCRFFGRNIFVTSAGYKHQAGAGLNMLRFVVVAGERNTDGITKKCNPMLCVYIPFGFSIHVGVLSKFVRPSGCLVHHISTYSLPSKVENEIPNVFLS